MRRFGVLFLAGACLVAHARDEHPWELREPQFQNLEATPGSPVVRRLLDEPIDVPLKRAEAARVALHIFGRTEEARLLTDFMEREIVAEVLGLPHQRAGTVGEAIAQQRAKPTPVSDAEIAQAMRVARERGARANDRGRVFILERGVMFGPDGISFGYPGSQKGSARDMAHEIVFAADCADRGTCFALTAYFRSSGGRELSARTAHFIAVLLGGPALVWAMVRGIAWLPLGEGDALRRPWLLGLLFAPPVPVIAWFVALMSGMLGDTRNLGLGIFPITGYAIIASYVISALWLATIVPLLWRLRALTFGRVVLAAVALAIVLPPAWSYLAFGSVWDSLSFAVNAVIYAATVAVLFCLLSWPTRSGEPPSRPLPRLLVRALWFGSFVAVHGSLLGALLYSGSAPHRDLSYYGIYFTSMIPWLPLGWLGTASDAVRFGWCATIWLVIYWLLAGVMTRMSAAPPLKPLSDSPLHPA